MNSLESSNLTFREWAKAYLTERGFFDRDADSVVEQWIANEVNEPMTGRWNHKVSGYPSMILAIFTLSLNRTAIRWIEANKPLAWFKPMFEDKAETSG